MSETVEKLRVMFAGGGTGGHLYPAIAMYEGLVERVGDVAVLFVGARGGLEGGLLPAMGLPLVLLPGRGMRGVSSLNKVQRFFEFLNGVIQGVRTILSFKPDVVVGTGGYASAATVVASIFCRVPRILQEQNSVPGLVNRKLARFANCLLLSYQESAKDLPARVPVAVIGNPVRKMPPRDRVAGAKFFGLDPSAPTVLILGGSRGAHSLNVAGADAAKLLTEEEGTQFIFLTGKNDYEHVKHLFASGRAGVSVNEYVDEMHHAYSAADVAVARAGASSVFELAVFGVPTIFVPYPFAADDHQRLNVESLRGAGRAVVLADSELGGGRLAAEIRSLIENPGRRSEMSRGMMDWVKSDAAGAAADRIVTTAQTARKRAGRYAKGIA